jgi:hypothetical protein
MPGIGQQRAAPCDMLLFLTDIRMMSSIEKTSALERQHHVMCLFATELISFAFAAMKQMYEGHHTRKADILKSPFTSVRRQNIAQRRLICFNIELFKLACHSPCDI